MSEVRDMCLPASIVMCWKIGSEMSASTLFAAEGGSRDERANGQKTGEPPGLAIANEAASHLHIKPALLGVEPAYCIAKRFRVTKQAHVRPHQPSEYRLVEGRSGGRGRRRRNRTIDRQRQANRSFWPFHRQPGPGSEDQPLEQRVARETIGTVHTRASHFA